MAGATMSNYQERYDSHLASAHSAVANLIPDLEEASPGLTPSKVRRLFVSISNLLARLDKHGAKFPEYLAHQAGLIPEQAIAALQNVPNLTANGAVYFVTNGLPQFLEFESRLIRAIGIGAYTIQDIKSVQVLELQSILQTAQDSLARTQAARRELAEQQAQLKEAVQQIERQRTEAQESISFIEKTRHFAAKLASGDARGNSSLEKIIRLARTKNDELQELITRAETSTAKAEELKSTIETISDRTTAIMSSLEDTGAKATAILHGATQAGLAGAYKTERDRLSKEQRIYAMVFYGIIVGVILYAALFILPLFGKIVDAEHDTSTTVGEMGLLVGVRLVILLPAVWALLFTSKRHAKIETLQMDYAAKANTALAYSGYREEMSGDAELSAKLKDGLLVRFLEHPERLLSKNVVSEAVDVGPDGVRYTSQSEPAKVTPISPDTSMAAE